MEKLVKQPIVDQCLGCANIEGEFCKIWVSPATKWRMGTCPSAIILKSISLHPSRKCGWDNRNKKRKYNGD